MSARSARPTRVLAALLVVALAAGVLALARRGESGPEPAPSASIPRDAYMERACEIPAVWAKRIRRGWEPGPATANDLAFVPAPPVFAGSPNNTAHSGPYAFLQEVPLVLYGRGYVQPRGHVELEREVTVADLAPTFAHLMRFDMPRRAGRALTEVVEHGSASPRLLVTAVIDGGGWNVLEHWPGAWPNLQRLIARGVNVDRATVGSTPSITPAIHTNLSTGAWPRHHGVTSIVERAEDGELVGAFSVEPRYSGSDIEPGVNLRMTTLADLWDRSMGNEPKVAGMGFGNYVAGMLGHGSALPGADKDIAILEEAERWATAPEYFWLPEYLNTEVPGPERDLAEVDRADGRLDDRWRGHPLEPLDATPAFAGWQQRTLAELIRREGFGDDEVPDLLYVNYKAPDAAGHKWNMVAPEQRDAIASVDRALDELVRLLDRELGEDGYVLAVTADHGQTPLRPEGWAIDGPELKSDLRATFDHADNGRGIVESSTATTYFLDAAELRANAVTAEQLASWLSRYTVGENISGEVPDGLEDRVDDPMFSAVIPGDRIDDVVACTKGNGPA